MGSYDALFSFPNPDFLGFPNPDFRFQESKTRIGGSGSDFGFTKN